MTIKYNVQTRQFETVPPEAHIPDYVKNMRKTLIERDPQYEEITHLHDGELWIEGKWGGTEYVHKVTFIKEDRVEVEKDWHGERVKYLKSDIGINQ